MFSTFSFSKQLCRIYGGHSVFVWKLRWSRIIVVKMHSAVEKVYATRMQPW